MDSVRFGRALGFGARMAAKTLVQAVDAAAAPNPGGSKTSTPQVGKEATPLPASNVQAGAPTVRVEASPARTLPAAGPRRAPTLHRAEQVLQTGAGIAEGSRRFGQAVWNPFVRLSGVLWLELTGVFFGLFALTAAIGAWKLRAGLNTGAGTAEAHTRFLVAVGMAVLFGYFALSSFVRASRRGKSR